MHDFQPATLLFAEKDPYFLSHHGFANSEHLKPLTRALKKIKITQLA